APALESKQLQFVPQPFPSRPDLINVRLNEVAVGQGLLQALQGKNVNVEWRTDASQNQNLLGGSGENAQTHAGESVSFGKRAGNNQIGDHPNLIEQGLATEIKIGFVQEHGSFRRRFQNLEDVGPPGNRSRWIIGISDDDDLGAGRDRPEDSLGREAVL